MGFTAAGAGGGGGAGAGADRALGSGRLLSSGVESGSQLTSGLRSKTVQLKLFVFSEESSN